jgi:hypothetical protein
VKGGNVITPSALNVLIIGCSVILFNLLLRMAAAKLAERDSSFADAIGTLT